MPASHWISKLYVWTGRRFTDNWLNGIFSFTWLETFHYNIHPLFLSFYFVNSIILQNWCVGYSMREIFDCISFNVCVNLNIFYACIYINLFDVITYVVISTKPVVDNKIYFFRFQVIFSGLFWILIQIRFEIWIFFDR
jgi:hypothetical protein